MTAPGGGKGRPIYLDYQATTPVDRRVLEAMLPYFSECFGNPHSVTHAYGAEAAAAVERAREQIATLIGAEAREIVFTSGATESNNLAIKGAAWFEAAVRGRRRDHLVTLATEHKCVLESGRRLAREGFRVTELGVGGDGLVDLGALEAAIDERTLLVSVMKANNEIGVIQPIAEIGALCRSRGVLFHSDCAQAVGKLGLDVNAASLDLVSVSGHKIYAPKGIGVLYVRRRPRARLLPLIDGGGQERGLRSGTLPVPLCVGLGEASAIAGREMTAEAERLERLRARLLAGLEARIKGVAVNGSLERRLAGNLNVSFEGVEAHALMAAAIDEVAVSSGSACTSAAVEPSYVLRALGASEARAAASIRFGLGRFTTEGEIDAAAEAIARHVAALRGTPARVAG